MVQKIKKDLHLSVKSSPRVSDRSVRFIQRTRLVSEISTANGTTTESPYRSWSYKWPTAYFQERVCSDFAVDKIPPKFSLRNNIDGEACQHWVTHKYITIISAQTIPTDSEPAIARY